MKSRVFVTRMIPQAGIDLLSETCDVEVYEKETPIPRDEFLSRITGKDGVLCLLTEKINAEVFDAAPSVKGFANYAVGFDNLDVAEATKRKIPLSNTPGVLTDATAEMA